MTTVPGHSPSMTSTSVPCTRNRPPNGSMVDWILSRYSSTSSLMVGVRRWASAYAAIAVLPWSVFEVPQSWPRACMASITSDVMRARPGQNGAVFVIRPARAADYDPIAAVVDDWWGRPVLPGLPRLFLEHFHRTSLVAEEDGALVGFLVGLLSPSRPDEAY